MTRTMLKTHINVPAACVTMLRVDVELYGSCEYFRRLQHREKKCQSSHIFQIRNQQRCVQLCKYFVISYSS
jgi:hypothetical protein